MTKPNEPSTTSAATRSRELELRFASLEQASIGLSADVGALNQTLQVVNQLQTEQRAQGDRQRKTEEELAATKQASAEREDRVRTVVRLGALAFALIVPLVTVLLYISLIGHVNDLLSQQKSDRFNSCLVRNGGTLENIKREQALAGLETNPRIATIHSNSAAALQKSLVNCEQYRPIK